MGGVDGGRQGHHQREGDEERVGSHHKLKTTEEETPKVIRRKPLDNEGKSKDSNFGTLILLAFRHFLIFLFFRFFRYR